jgi:hypothetical protein
MIYYMNRTSQRPGELQYAGRTDSNIIVDLKTFSRPVDGVTLPLLQVLLGCSRVICIIETTMDFVENLRVAYEHL